MRGFVRYPFFLALCLCLWASCKTPAPPPEPKPEPPREAPRYSLVFEGVKAESPARVSLRYTLRGENRAAGEAGMAIRGWKVLLNREDAPLSFPAGAGAALESAAGEGSTLLLDLDLELPEDGEDFDEYHVELTLNLAGAAGDIPVAAEAVFPRIREPEFVITSIAILKDELVNTRFKVELRIHNPNIFPVVLSSFGYELYGKDRFWAKGREQDVLEVPAQSSAETKLFLIMNFINMKRDLLDEVIALGSVPYRFTGEARVDTGISLLPSFTMGFDRRGTSVVLK